MSLLLDVFGYLTVILRGITISAQDLTIGGIVFLQLVAWPFAARLGAGGPEIVRRSRRLLGWSAFVLALAEAAFLAMQAAVLMDTAELSLAETLGADFAIDVVGTMMWAYGVPFHITHGPPLVHSVGYASS